MRLFCILSFWFDGCCVLVIGVGWGIGFVVVVVLVEVGVVVMLVVCSVDEIEVVVCVICEVGGMVEGVVFDVLDFVVVCVFFE